MSLRRATTGRRGPLRLELAFRRPADLDRLAAFLGHRAVPGVELLDSADGHWTYTRSVRLPGGTGVVEVHAPAPHHDALPVVLHLRDPADQDDAVRRVRNLFNLDADPSAVDAVLGADPLLASSVRRRPGLRVPGHVDPDELVVRAVLGQQVSVKGARTFAARLVERHGAVLAHPRGPVTHEFPTSEALASGSLEGLGLTGGRMRALHAVCAALASGEIDLGPGADPDTASGRLLAVPGIGPWTVSYARMRTLADADAFLETDLGVKHAMTSLGMANDPRSIRAHAERWRPYRAHALMHLWCMLGDE